MNNLSPETVEHLRKGPYGAIIDAVGPEGFLNLCRVVGGGKTYFPKQDKILAYERDLKITEEFNGFNAYELAHKYNLTTVHVERILKHHYKGEK